MRDQSFQNILESRVGCLGINQVYIVGYVVNGEILEDRYINLPACSCHCGVVGRENNREEASDAYMSFLVL